ncbi:MAG: outer membrane beta-barrel protein [Bacteroidota bacterium]
MKKIIYSLIGLGFFASTTYAQEAFDKKFQFGLTLAGGLNFNKPLSNIVERDGVGTDLIFGLNVMYNFNATLALNTGIELDFDRFKYQTKSGDSLYYYYYDTEIYQKDEYEAANPKNFFRLNNRLQTGKYLTVPVNVVMKTKPFGNLQYFGKFGTRLSFLMGVSRTFDKGFAADSVTLVSGTTELENNEMESPKDLNFFKASVGLSGGAMWNFSGSTMLVAELGFHYGLTPIHSRGAIGGDEERNFTIIRNDSNIEKFVGIEAKQSQLILKLSLYF